MTCSPSNASEQVEVKSYSRVVLGTLYELFILNKLAWTRALKWKPFSQKEATEEPGYRSQWWFLMLCFMPHIRWETAMLALTHCLVAVYSHSHMDGHLKSFFHRAAFKQLHSLKWKLLGSLASYFRGCEQGEAMSHGLPSASGALSHWFQRQKEGERVESSTLSKKRSVVERNSKKEEA